MVYFVATVDRQFIRIGYSDKWHKRMAAIKKDARERFDSDVVILGYFPGNFNTEAWIQLRFANYRYHGDWFMFEPEIQTYIDTVRLLPASWELGDSMRKASIRTYGLPAEEEAEA